MDINIKTQEQHLVTIVVNGDMDAIGCKDIKHVFEDVIAIENSYEIILDLEKVSFMDSSGVGAIVYLYRRLKSLNRAISLHNVCGQPLELMELLKIDSAISIQPKVNQPYRTNL